MNGLIARQIATKHLIGKYDYVILAGGTLGPLVDFPPTPMLHWQQAFLDHLSLSHTLHHITRVVVLDHLDCGACKKFGLPAGQADPGTGVQRPPHADREVGMPGPPVHPLARVRGVPAGVALHLGGAGEVEKPGHPAAGDEDGVTRRVNPRDPPSASACRRRAGRSGAQHFERVEQVTFARGDDLRRRRQVALDGLALGLRFPPRLGRRSLPGVSSLLLHLYELKV